MAEIIQFVPRRERGARGNLVEFMRHCKDDLTVFGEDLKWDDNDWDITNYVDKRGRRGRDALVFSTFDAAGARGNITPMAQPILDFAKAYMRYQHAIRPTNDFGKRLAALRALEKALIERSLDGVPHVEKTDPELLNAAARLFEQTPASAYRMGNQLEMIAKFLVTHQLVARPFTWKNPIKRDKDVNIRVGKEAEERRAKKLPSAETIDALIDAYRSVVEPRDVISTSVSALLVSAPDRINEVFRLPVMCEHEVENDGGWSYGLRWWPSKGAEPQIKWIVNTMADVVHEAVERLKEHTKEAREIALWYEKNPGKLYLPKGCEHLRNKEFLSAAELGEIVGLPGHQTRWADEQGLQVAKRDRAPGQETGAPTNFYRSEDLEKAVVAMLPEGFPVYDEGTGLKYSDALLLVPMNFFHKKRGTYRCMFEIVTTDTINNEFGSGEQHGKSSIFSRLDVRGADGKPFKITTHQFRHWLNTLAQNAGLSQLHIAKWSGRMEIKQNAHYDHRTGAEMIAKARECKLIGPIADFVANSPMSKEEFLSLVFPTAHVTEYGYCIHDWTVMPCDKHRDCLLCTEQVCVKGNVRTETVREQLVMEQELLRRAKEAVAKDYFGADRWLDYHHRRIEVLRGHVAILDNPDIPEDSLYQVSGISEHSPVRQSIQARMERDDPDAAVLRMVMERIGLNGHNNGRAALPHLG